MNIGGFIMAPVFGLWVDTDDAMPEEDTCVLGCGWTADHTPIVVLMYWVESEDGEQLWKLWGRDVESPPPWCWCEARFIQPVAEADDIEEGCPDCGFSPELN
jgi:hypothetical protein